MSKGAMSNEFYDIVTVGHSLYMINFTSAEVIPSGVFWHGFQMTSKGIQVLIFPQNPEGTLYDDL